MLSLGYALDVIVRDINKDSEEPVMATVSFGNRVVTGALQYDPNIKRFSICGDSGYFLTFTCEDVLYMGLLKYRDSIDVHIYKKLMHP